MGYTQNKFIFTQVFALAAVLVAGNTYAAYPVANIKNNTKFEVEGTVHYAGGKPFCENDKFKVAPLKTWKAESRGVCLITKITASGKDKVAAKKDPVYTRETKKFGEIIAKGMKDPLNYIKSGQMARDSESIKRIPNYDKYNADMVSYESSGTSYAKFYIAPFNANYRVLSEAEYKDNGTGYPTVHLTNRTKFPINGTVEYTSAFCSDDKFSIPAAKVNQKQPDQIIPGTWRAASRGVCLVDKITAKANGSNIPLNLKTITSYTSTGTSYSKFRIQPYAGAYRVYSEEEFKTELARQNKIMSPGFRIHNKTKYPVNIGLEQLGCLYHGIIQPESMGGKPFVRSTGAVWFTISARTVPFGAEESSDWDCVEPVAELVVDIAIGAATGGSASAALTAAKVAAKAGIKTGIKKAAYAGVKAGGKKIISSSTKEVVQGVALVGVKKGAMAATNSDGYLDFGENLFLLGSAFTAPPGLNNLAAQAFLEKRAAIAWEKSQNIRETSEHGEYAGYEWPFRCDKMPEYHITGGPTTGDWSQGTPLRIKKINDCGNDLM